MSTTCVRIMLWKLIHLYPDRRSASRSPKSRASRRIPASIRPYQGEEVRALDNGTENVTVDAPSAKRSCTEVGVSEMSSTPVRTRGTEGLQVSSPSVHSDGLIKTLVCSIPPEDPRSSVKVW